MRISLIGYMGSGKSTVGKELASQLNIDFFDLDQFIETQHNSSIENLFQTKGEIVFRKLEREALLEILSLEKPFVLALGGGTPAYYKNMNEIINRSFSVYLRLNPKELTARLKNEKSLRPLISHLSDEELPEFIAKHLFERCEFYEMADFKLDGKEKSINQIVSEIIQNLPKPLPK